MSLSSLESLDVKHLTDAEKEAIATVLRRDDSLRNKDHDRVKELRAEIKKIRLKGVLRDGQDADKSCARCRTEFGWVFNKGAVCTKCQFKVCDKCQDATTKGKWLCVLCHRQQELEGMSGNWFYSRFRKSKRHKRNNKVITGGEIIKASFRKTRTSEYNGTADRGVRVTEDIKRALTNNNASPKRTGPNAHSGPEEESSDTQSMEMESPRRKPQPLSVEDDPRYSAFPRESDRMMLMELMHSSSRSPRLPNAVNGQLVKTQRIQVSSHRYDSDSSSTDSGSAPSSPQFSRRTESTFTPSDSVRSSFRSSSAASSDGRITMVTDNISQISDFDTYSLGTVSAQDSPNMARKSTVSLPLGATARTHTATKHNSSERRSVDSAIEQPSHSSQFDSGEEPGIFTVKARKGREESSDSSTTEDEFTTEQLTRIKFKRVSSGGTPRSPEPDPRQDTHKRPASRPSDQGAVVVAEVSGARRPQLGLEAEPRPLEHNGGDHTNTGVTVHATSGQLLGSGPVQSDSLSSTSSMSSKGSDEIDGGRVATVNPTASPSVRARVDALLSKHKKGSEVAQQNSSSSRPDDKHVNVHVAALHKGGARTEYAKEREGDFLDVPPVATQALHGRRFDSDDDDEDFADNVSEDTDLSGYNIETSSFEDLEWDADLLFPEMKQKKTPESIEKEIEDELRAAIQDSFDANLVPADSSRHSPSQATAHLDSKDDAADLQYPSVLRVNRFGRMYIAEMDEEDDDDSLSVISERTEPEYDTEEERGKQEQEDEDEDDYSSSSTDVDEDQYDIMVTSLLANRQTPSPAQAGRAAAAASVRQSTPSPKVQQQPGKELSTTGRKSPAKHSSSPVSQSENGDISTPSPKVQQKVRELSTGRKSPAKHSTSPLGHLEDKNKDTSKATPSLKTQSATKPTTNRDSDRDAAVTAVAAAAASSQKHSPAIAVKTPGDTHTQRGGRDEPQRNTSHSPKHNTQSLKVPNSGVAKPAVKSASGQKQSPETDHNIVVPETVVKVCSTPVKSAPKRPEADVPSLKVDLEEAGVPESALQRRDTITRMANEAEQQGHNSTNEEEFSLIFEQNKPFVSDSEWLEVMHDSKWKLADKTPKHAGASDKAVKGTAVTATVVKAQKSASQGKTNLPTDSKSAALPTKDSAASKHGKDATKMQRKPAVAVAAVAATTTMTKTPSPKRSASNVDPDSPIDDSPVASVNELQKMFDHPPSYMLPGARKSDPVDHADSDQITSRPHESVSPSRASDERGRALPVTESGAERPEVMTFEAGVSRYREVPVDNDYLQFTQTIPNERAGVQGSLASTHSTPAVKRVTPNGMGSAAGAKVAKIDAESSPDPGTDDEGEDQRAMAAAVSIVMATGRSPSDDRTVDKSAISGPQSLVDGNVGARGSARISRSVPMATDDDVIPMETNNNVYFKSATLPADAVSMDSHPMIVPEKVAIVSSRPPRPVEAAQPGPVPQGTTNVLPVESLHDEHDGGRAANFDSSSLDRHGIDPKEVHTSTPDKRVKTLALSSKDPRDELSDGELFARPASPELVATNAFYPSHDHEVLHDAATAPGKESTLTPGILLTHAPPESQGTLPGGISNVDLSQVARRLSAKKLRDSHRESFVYFDPTEPSVESPNLSFPTHEHEVLLEPETDPDTLWQQVEAQQSRILSHEETEDNDDRVRGWLGIELPPVRVSRGVDSDSDLSRHGSSAIGRDYDVQADINSIEAEFPRGGQSDSSIAPVSSLSERDSVGSDWDFSRDPRLAGSLPLEDADIQTTDLDAFMESMDSSPSPVPDPLMTGNLHDEIFTVLAMKPSPESCSLIPGDSGPVTNHVAPTVSDHEVASMYLTKSRSAGMSAASLDVLVDDASDTAEERAHPDNVEEDFAQGLYSGIEGRKPGKYHNKSGRSHQNNLDPLTPDSHYLPVEADVVAFTSTPPNHRGRGSDPLGPSSATPPSAYSMATNHPSTSPPNSRAARLTTAYDPGSVQVNNDDDDVPTAIIAGTTTIVKVTSHGNDDTDSDYEAENPAVEQDTTLSLNDEQIEAPAYDSQTEADRHLEVEARAHSDTSSEMHDSKRGSMRSQGSGSLHSGRSAGAAVPAIAVVHATDRAEKSSLRSATPSDREEDNIDDIVASYSGSRTGSINSRSLADDSALSQRSTALLSPFSDRSPVSREPSVMTQPQSTTSTSASTWRSKSNQDLLASRESIMSYYSEAGEGNYGKIPITGEIQFAMEYNYKCGVFEVRIKQCKDLAPVDPKKKRSDPYVKMYLLPDKTKTGKRKTHVKKNTLHPVFNEMRGYTLTKSELETRTLWITVWHNDIFGRNDFLGEVTIPLDYHNFDDVNPKWYRLQERAPIQVSNSKWYNESGPYTEMGLYDTITESPEHTAQWWSDREKALNPSPLALLTYKGDLQISLKYITAENVMGKKRGSGRGQLHVLIKQARNLTAVRSNGYSDPFVKGYLLPERSRHYKEKTPVMKKNCNPEFNHTFVFEDIRWEELRDRCLELTIWDYDRFTSNDFLGGVRLSLGSGLSSGKEVEWMDSKGEEITLWQSMLDTPNYWKEGTLLLRPNMDRRK